MDENNITEELYNCFNLIRSTVEGVIPYNNSLNIWNVPGGLKRVKKAAFEILKNGLRVKKCTSTDLEEDPVKQLCLKLIPSSGNNIEDAQSEVTSEEILNEWLENHLLAHSLHECIKNLLIETWSEKTLSSYKEYAYVKNEELLKSFLACLDALQQGSMNQLSIIKPTLMNRSTFTKELKPWVVDKIVEEDEYMNLQEKQLSQIKNTYGLYTSTETDEFYKDEVESQKDSAISAGVFDTPALVQQSSMPQDLLMNSALSVVCENDEDDTEWYSENNAIKRETDVLKMCYSREMSRSDSSLYQESVEVTPKKSLKNMRFFSLDESKTSIDSIPALPRSSTNVSVLRKGHTRSRSDQLGGCGKVDKVDRLDDLELSLPATSSSLPKQIEDVEDCYYRYDDGQLVPKPYEGQSLYSYLESRNYDTGAQLDKENAHFSICEALIAAIEQMRCQSLALKNSTSKGSIQSSSQSNIDESAFSNPSSSATTSPCTNTSATSSSTDPTTDDTCFSDTATTATPDSFHNKRSIGMSWENVSLVSPRKLKKELDMEKPEVIKDDEIPPNDFSAEAVAKSLLQKFNGHKLPAASELKWIVSEIDTPQELLPLPTAWPVSPDSYLRDDEQPFSVKSGMGKMTMPSLLRGTYEWAPPRPQIIFIPHPFVKRKVMLQRQHYRCRGCGLKVSPDLSKTFRLCEYLGKYFCTSCHQKEESVIPGKILSKWDFKKYPISDFARDLLKKIHLDPLFNVMDVSPKLYENVRPLNITKNYRIKLHYMKRFLETCRYAEGCQKELSKIPMHITDDPHSYSIDDLLQVKNGELQKTLSSVLARGMKHIQEECQVCQLKGFICEICSTDDILYPFELQKVSICQTCKACYHKQCFVKGCCQRCKRIQARKEQLKTEFRGSPEQPR